MRGKAILIAAATVLVVGGGGAAAWVAVNDEDHPSTALLSNSQPPRETEAETEADPAPPTPPTATEEEAPPQQAPQEPDTTQPAPDSGQSTGAPRRKTHFKREKRNPSNDAPERQFAVPPAREFSGEGNARLGTVDVKATSILRWKTKGHFEVRFGREAFPIIAPTKSGQLVLPPFRFEQVRVIAAGRWKITVSPQ
jgi:hypothetical protein